MYFWSSIVWMFRPSVCFFHYVLGFFLKYKEDSFQICGCVKVNLENEQKM